MIQKKKFKKHQKKFIIYLIIQVYIHKLLQIIIFIKDLKDIPLLIFINKQKNSTFSIVELQSELNLYQLKDINWKLQYCVTTSGSLFFNYKK